MTEKCIDDMDKLKRLDEALRQYSGTTNINIVAAEVLSVDGERCSVKIRENLEVTDVRLKATINGSGNKILITPVVGSYVLLGSLTGDEKDLTIVQMDEVEKVEYKQDEVKFTINATKNEMEANINGTIVMLDDKVKIRNNIYGLLELILEFIDICRDEIHMTNAGPTVSLNPANKVLFNLLKEKFGKLLKN